jgi:hypothetical protein
MKNNKLRELPDKIRDNHDALAATFGVAGAVVLTFLIILSVLLFLIVMISVGVALGGLIKGFVLYVLWNYIALLAFPSLSALSFLQCFAIGAALSLLSTVFVRS